MTGGRERVREDDDRVERVGWMVKSSRRYVGWEDCREDCREMYAWVDINTYIAGLDPSV